LSARTCGFESRPGHSAHATPDDARAVAEVHVSSWRAGYQGLVLDGYLARMSVDKREEMWRTRRELLLTRQTRE
jgi:hypothetical protein